MLGPTLNQHWMNISCLIGDSIQSNTAYWPDVVLMLVHRLRRWPSVKTTLGQGVAFAGMADPTLLVIANLHVAQLY